MNILSKRVSITTIEISTKELLENFRASINDVIWDQRPDDDKPSSRQAARCNVETYTDQLSEATKALVSFDIDAIVELFNSGFSMMLLGKAFDTLQKCDIKGGACQVIVTSHLGSSSIIPQHKLEY